MWRGEVNGCLQNARPAIQPLFPPRSFFLRIPLSEEVSRLRMGPFGLGLYGFERFRLVVAISSFFSFAIHASESCSNWHVLNP